MKAALGPFIVAILIMGLASPAMAGARVTCLDADRAIVFSYTVDSNASQPILKVEMQLTDDFGLSTDPAHPNNSGEYVAHGFIIEGMHGADLLWQDDDGNELRVMSFRIGTVHEAKQERIGGVVSVAGGGVWTVTCQADEDRI